MKNSTLYEGGVRIYKKKKTEKPLWLKITQNRKTAIDFDQNRKPHTKSSKPKIYTAQFSSQNTSLDLKRRWYVDMIILDVNIYVIIGFYGRKTDIFVLGPSRPRLFKRWIALSTG